VQLVSKIKISHLDLCGPDPPTSQTDRRTDERTTCNRKFRNTALCTMVHQHRAVKIIQPGQCWIVNNEIFKTYSLGGAITIVICYQHFSYGINCSSAMYKIKTSRKLNTESGKPVCNVLTC